MIGMPPPIDRYRELSAISSRMAEAARSGDWDRLDALQRCLEPLRDRDVTEAIEPAPPADAAQMSGLIRKILDDDAEVRRHTEPWTEQLRLLLAGHLSGWRVPPSQPGDEPDGRR